jgi:ATP-dependent protease ClpP protease subunit
LKSLPIKTTMHNIGNVDSIGNAIFLAGQERIACPHASFMFHGVGFNAQTERFEERQLREKLDGILAEQTKIGSIIADQTSLKSEEIKGLFREASTKNAQFALDNGIVQSISDVIIPPGVPMIQLVFNR